MDKNYSKRQARKAISQQWELNKQKLQISKNSTVKLTSKQSIEKKRRPKEEVLDLLNEILAASRESKEKNENKTFTILAR